MKEPIYWTGLNPNPLKPDSDGAGFLITNVTNDDFEFCRKAVENILSYFGEEYSITDSTFLKDSKMWAFDTDLPYYKKYVGSEIYKMQLNVTPLASLIISE